MELTHFCRVAPSFMAIGCVSTYGRIVWWITPLDSHQSRLLWCSPRFFAPVLITLGFISAVSQLGGACSLVTTLLTSSTSNIAALADDGVTWEVPESFHTQYWVDTAVNLIRSGLVVQLAILGAFIVISTRYILISRRWIKRTLAYAPRPGASWRMLSCTVYGAVVLMIVSRFQTTGDCLLTSEHRSIPPSVWPNS
jgi:hypothetical protein